MLEMIDVIVITNTYWVLSSVPGTHVSTLPSIYSLSLHNNPTRQELFIPILQGVARWSLLANDSRQERASGVGFERS